MAKNSILGLEPKKLANLLGITFDSDQKSESDSNEATAQILEDRLAGPFMADTQILQSAPSDSSQKDDGDCRYSGVPLGDVLTASTSDFATIRDIKRRAKKMTKGEESPSEHIAVTIYFAAIANALLHHKAKITSYSYESLQVSFNKLMNKSWMTQGLRQLFTDAVEVCRNKTQEQESQ